MWKNEKMNGLDCRVRDIKDTLWTEVKTGRFECSVKHYEVGSEYGINGGRISKLSITRDGRWVCNYDREWDIKPKDAATRKIYEALVKKYN